MESSIARNLQLLVLVCAPHWHELCRVNTVKSRPTSALRPLLHASILLLCCDAAPESVALSFHLSPGCCEEGGDGEQH
jgi:hypothetical protein